MNRDRIAFVLVFAVQMLCASVFLYDILTSVFGLQSAPISWALYELIEIGAALGLILGVCVTGWLLYRSFTARSRAEESLRLASGAFADVLEERFSEWRLTPAERDVAMMAIKGFSISEIAALRKTSEGTVKAQTNAIYRKAGVSGRSQLMSVFIDELLTGQIGERL